MKQKTAVTILGMNLGLLFLFAFWDIFISKSHLYEWRTQPHFLVFTLL
ncbi:MAG: hypothetical protein U0M15_00385 [Bacillota bacterium]|nr:hypothetical protein [Bacillota bacterium]